jgi:AraC-like DNA-binding protein
MRELIEDHPERALSLADIAREVGRQPSYLSRLFREEVGCGVHTYLVRVRMQRAMDLLRQGEKVEAVAAEVGYRSKTNFFRHFKRQFGVTPGAWRARL